MAGLDDRIYAFIYGPSSPWISGVAAVQSRSTVSATGSLREPEQMGLYWQVQVVHAAPALAT